MVVAVPYREPSANCITRNVASYDRKTRVLRWPLLATTGGVANECHPNACSRRGLDPAPEIKRDVAARDLGGAAALHETVRRWAELALPAATALVSGLRLGRKRRRPGARLAPRLPGSSA